MYVRYRYHSVLIASFASHKTFKFLPVPGTFEFFFIRYVPVNVFACYLPVPVLNAASAQCCGAGIFFCGAGAEILKVTPASLVKKLKI